MAALSAFDFPPLFGNAIAYVAYYAAFLAIQAVLSLRYLRTWNWPIFLGLGLFLIFEILGSVAYVEMHYTPVTGSLYTLYVSGMTIAPIFLISTLHFCTRRALQLTHPISAKHRFSVALSKEFFVFCLGIDSLALLLAVIGSIYLGVMCTQSLEAPQPGFNIMTAAMAIEACSVIILLVEGIEFTRAFVSRKREGMDKLQRPRLFWAFLANLLFIELILLAFFIVRAIDLAGGLHGPLRNLLLVNIETIFLFVVLFFFTPLHPAINLGESVWKTSEEAKSQKDEESH